jgi:hypothetical protein
MGGLTGDFDAVLQVNGGTLSRLLATMHQNSVEQDSMPQVPHVASFRIGGSVAEGGPRGSVAAQIGVPRPTLIDGSRDRFRTEVGFRARYRADPDSVPLADVIRGTVRAEYRLQEVDDSCHGWKGIAADYRWLRVIRSSVGFEGTVYNDNADLIAIEPIAVQQVKELVAEQLAELLSTRFAPAPQPLGRMFRRLRCLSAGSGPTQAAIAFPVGLDGGEPAGSASSIVDRFLESRDFGVAVSADYAIGSVQDQLGPLAGMQRDFHIHGDAGIAGGLEIDYHIRLDSARAEWLGADGRPDRGLVRIRLDGSGWASRLYKSGVFNLSGVTAGDLRMSFGVEQRLGLGFDPYGERVVISPLGPPAVSVNYGGPFASQVKSGAEAAISSHVQGALAGALGQAQQQLAALSAPARKAALLEQLRRLDRAAAARFDEAVFGDEGIVLRGTVSLSRRRPPRVQFRATAANDGFDAIESWIPGGRVDSFEWSWRFYSNPIQGPAGPPGAAVEKNDFMLRRPHGAPTKFGLFKFAKKPLPGLDGNGSLCMTIRGVRVDPVSGALVPVESERECEQFGYEFHLPIEVAPWLPVCDPWLEPEKEGPFPEIGIQQVGGGDPDRPDFNLLVLALPLWDEELISILVHGLEDCRKVGAGLMVALLFPEGFLADPGSGIGSKLEGLAKTLPAPLLAAENVAASWSQALALSKESVPAWRLLAPGGTFTWLADGLPEREGLARILDRRLHLSAPPTLAAAGPRFGIGELLPIELLVPPCPPVPLSQPGGGGWSLIFVKAGHEPSLVELQAFAAEVETRSETAPVGAVVADADAEAVDRLKAELGLDLPLFPDPDGDITRRAGVRFSPSRLQLDEEGRLTGVRMGIQRGRAER